jgi:hypothetical protein
MKHSRYLLLLMAFGCAASLALATATSPSQAEQRNAVAHPRTPYRLSFYERHRRSYRVAGALHFGHSKLHDVLLLTDFEDHAEADAELYQEILTFLANPPNIEPSMELYAPYTARATWRLFKTIDSVHLLHEMTQDVLADADIPWDEKDVALQEVYDIYLDNYSDIALSPAPLDVTMRRAAVMMKPYFSLTRNYYPQNNNFFYAAHWWHPAVYESMMVGGNGVGQDVMMERMDRMFHDRVVAEPPKRMILSRELMPRYSRLSPETANVFDNLHMLHGITYDIFAYDGWTIEQKRAELYRVLDAMSYQPGDEELARKFDIPRPDIDPLDYNDWITSADGAMTRIMLEMLDEMMPMHAMGHGEMDHDEMDHGEMDHGEMSMRDRLRDQLRLKLTPGLQDGELPGSFADAMMQIMPEMEMSREMMEPGVVSEDMVNGMLAGWRQKYGDMPDVPTLSMDVEPQWNGSTLVDDRPEP